MQWCECGYDKDRCDCPAKEEVPTLEQLMATLASLEAQVLVAKAKIRKHYRDLNLPL